MDKHFSCFFMLISLMLFFSCGDAPQKDSELPSFKAQVTQQEIERAIDKTGLTHPYLYFSEKDKPEILERVNNDLKLKKVLDNQIASAENALNETVDPVIPPRQMRPRYDDNYSFDRYIGSNTGKAFNLALVYQMTGDEKYAKKAFEFIKVVCDMPTWIHIVHEFDTIYDRVWPWGVKDDQVVFSYSQHTDHAVFQIAAIYDWLYPTLTQRQRDRIRGALLEKAILRVRGNYEYHWWATSYRCNWCTVCNSSLGVAAIALLTEDPQLTDVVTESYNRISKTIDEIKDGGWQEGMGYLHYTVKTSMTFANVLKNVSGGKLNLYKHPRLDDAVETFLYCQIPPGRSVHFGDSGSSRTGSYYMYNELMLETENRTASWLRDNIFGEGPSTIYDFFKPKSNLEPALPETASIFFPGVNWVVMRSDFTDPAKFAVFAKCGKNDDPHHGHLDVGHFTIFWHGQELICDWGSAGYDRRYFDKERWDYPLAVTIGHNTVMVNGEQQMPCKEKNKPWNLNYGGKVVEFRPGKDRDYAYLDPTDAYPGEELKSWHRHLIYEKPAIAVIIDEVKSTKGAEIEARFHSRAGMDLRKDFVILNGNKGTAVLIPVVEGDIKIRQGEHRFIMDKINAKERVVPYFGTVVKAQNDKTVIGTIILPVEDENEAGEITNSVKSIFDSSGNFSLSFAKSGKTYSYEFANAKNGLILKDNP